MGWVWVEQERIPLEGAGWESDGLVGNEGQEGGPMAETCVPKP